LSSYSSSSGVSAWRRWRKRVRKILEALAAYYLAISVWNVIFLAYHA